MARPTPDLLAPRIAPASRLTSFGGYRPAVCGHPTGMILTRARTLLRPCFARLLAALVGEPDGFAAGAFHARPLRWRSKSRRARKRALGRQSALRPLRFAPTIVRRGDSLATENACRRNTPTASARSVADWERRHLGGVVNSHLQRGKFAALPIKMRLIWARRFRYNTHIPRGGVCGVGS